MKKKKIMALFLSLCMVLSLAACSSSTSDDEEGEAEEEGEEAESDLAYVQDKGVLVVGITDFEPMDYQDEDGTWIGFDADMANAFAESLGVTAEFKEINWDDKILELDSETIDCVWNGMTLTDEVLSSMDCSNAYSSNSQVVVLPADQQDADLSTLTFAVEAGSAGEAAATEAGYEVTPVDTQSTALMEVAGGTSDAAVIDLLMAEAMVGEGTSYADLVEGDILVDEEYGVGFRQGSDLVEALNEFFAACYEDGSMQEIAATYGIENSIIAQ